MKKHILLGAVLLSLMATSCSNDNIIDNDTAVVTGKTITLNATINNGADTSNNGADTSNNGADTRMTYDDNGSSMKAAWSNSESFILYKGTNGTGSTFTKTAESGSKFKGNDITGEGKYYAVYGNNISNNNGTLTIDLSQAQVGTAAENGIKEFMLATASELNSSTTLTFDHKLTVLKMTLTLPSDVTGKVSKVTVSGLHNKATYTLSSSSYAYAEEGKGDITATNGGEGFAITGNKITAYVAVFPEDVAAGQVTIKALVNGVEYRYTIASERKLTAGKVTPVTVPMTKVLNCASGNLTNEAVKAAIFNNNLIISSDADLTTNDFSVLRSVLTNGSYTKGTINLTLLNQTSLPVSGSTGALQGCSALKSVYAPEVTSVWGNAFRGCSSLSSVELPQATSVGGEAFYDCSSLTSVSLPKATSVGAYAFSGCSSLFSVELPKVTSVRNYTFAICSSLTSVSLPKATSVGDYAFGNCTSLTSVSLPQATSVGTGAFYGCTKSNIDLTVKGGTTWWGSESDWKSVTIIKVNFKSEYTVRDYFYWDAYTYVTNGDEETFSEGNYGYHTGIGVTAEHSCASCPTADQMMMYLGAGVYWDNGDAGTNQQTYTVNGNTYHTGLWVMKKEYISGFSAGTAKAVIKVSSSNNSDCWNEGRPAAEDIGKYFFLPAAGYCDYGKFYVAGSGGRYWSSSSVEDKKANFLCFNDSEAYVHYYYRGYGYLPMVAE